MLDWGKGGSIDGGIYRWPDGEEAKSVTSRLTREPSRPPDANRDRKGGWESVPTTQSLEESRWLSSNTYGIKILANNDMLENKHS